MKDNECISRFIELRAQGLSYQKIADELHVSKQTLLNWNKKFETDIAEQSKLELEALQEKYHLQRMRKVELFGEMLLRIEEQLNRQMDNYAWWGSKVPIVKLFDLLARYHSILEKEFGEAGSAGAGDEPNLNQEETTPASEPPEASPEPKVDQNFTVSADDGAAFGEDPPPPDGAEPDPSGTVEDLPGNSEPGEGGFACEAGASD